MSIIDMAILNRCNPIINNSLYEEQGGFRSNRGTEDQLAILRIILSNQKFVMKKPLYIATIDLQKAFDKVWIPGLLCKLYETGIRVKGIQQVVHSLILISTMS